MGHCAGLDNIEKESSLKNTQRSWKKDLEQPVYNRHARGLIKKVIGTAAGVGAGVLGYKAIKKSLQKLTGRESSEKEGRTHHFGHHGKYYGQQGPNYGHYGGQQYGFSPIEKDCHHGVRDTSVANIPISAAAYPQLIQNEQYHQIIRPIEPSTTYVDNHFHQHHHYNMHNAHPEYEHQEIIETHHQNMLSPRPIAEEDAVEVSTACVDKSVECHTYFSYCVKIKIRTLCPKTCGYCN
ncbi:hypothetical protein GJ496_004480 [Pomphorhynchus laevis]|nr:hypothetical protein GJ496_004480 [Pomphorhynchus laevis]